MLMILVLFFPVLSFEANAQNPERIIPVRKTAITENAHSKSDTARALKNLFQRKRRSTRVKVGIFGLVVDALLIRMWTHPHVLPQSGVPGAPPVMEGGSSVSISRYVAIGITTVVVMEIVTQQRYGRKKMKNLLDDYEAGKPIPLRIKSKLDLRDFD